jgi:hypothetical protein
MTVNKNNISTSADGADIFTIGAADSPFTNLGRLTTSGDLASAIRGTASGISITNRGDISVSGAGSPGLTVGDPFGEFYDHVTVNNYGTITNTGEIYASDVWLAFPDGIDVFGNYNQVTNFGSITTISLDGSGIGSVGANCLITNRGQITSAAFGIIIDTNDQPDVDSHNMVLNYGTIHTTGDLSRAIAFNTDDNTVNNYGTIQADGVHSFGISMEGTGNHGENRGTILATGEEGRGVLLFGGAHSFVNYGQIDSIGADGVGIRFGGDDPAGLAPNIFVNYGEVAGAGWAVLGWPGVDQVINRGAMAGAVDLGEGDDNYVAGKGGSLNGELTLGDGDDLIVFERGGGSLTVTDFVAGEGTDDAIDLSAFGFHSFADVMSHASQSGSDVILNLGGKDKIVLEGVSLGALAADDFALGDAAVHVHSALAHHDWFALA